MFPLLVIIALVASMLPTAALASVAEGEQATSSEAVGQEDASVDGAADDKASADGAVADDAEGDLPDGVEGGSPDAAPDADGPDAAPMLEEGASGSGDDAVSQPAAIEVKCGVIGLDADGAAEAWAPESTFEMKEGDAASTLLVAAFERAGLAADYDVDGPYGFYLRTITSPFDGRVLGWDEATGRYWQLFVNGEASDLGASSVKLSAGDVVTMAYSAFGEGIPQLPEQPAAIEVKCGIVGVDAAGNAQTWSSEKPFDVKPGATAADVTVAAFEDAGIVADYDPDGAYGFYLKTITSPFDGRVLGWDEATGKYWQLFVNGAASSVGASEVDLQAGDTVVWYYAADGASLPSDDDLVIDPGAPRPDLDADWPGFAGGSAGATVTTPTPTEAADLAWSLDFKEGAWWATVSDPLVVDGDIVFVAQGKVQRVDGETGKVVASAPTGENTQYICRPVYADGLIVIPFDGGKIAAYTADTLACVWKTASFAPEGSKATYQAMSSLTVANGCVYAMFSPQNGDNPTTEGVMVCVSLADGSTKWVKRTGTAAQEDTGGFYWAGAAASGDDLIVGDDFGKVALVDGESGEEISSVAVSGPCRAGIVAVEPTATGEGAYLAVTKTDGTLHKIERVGDELRLAGSVKFAATSTSTPAVARGKAVICGSDSASYPVNGTISVVDIATMTLESSVAAGSGQSQSSPLVSVQGDGIYAYFTCNSKPGGVYSYKIGDDKAYQLFAPEGSQQNYCISSIVADAEGNLYYTNDSGTLFKLSAAPSFSVAFDSNGGSTVSAFRVAQNKPMTKPGDPVREGYLFAGWFADEALTQPWDFSQPVSGDMTLYAKWNENAGAGGGVNPPVDPEGSNPTVPEGGMSASSPTVTVVPTYAVVTTRTPLSEVKQEAAASVADDDKVASATAKGVEGAGVTKEGAPVATAAGADSASATLNPLAVAGIALGIVVLLGVALYFVFARRRA